MRLLKGITTLSVFLLTTHNVCAKVTQHTADSIAALLNGKVPPGCDASCSLYAAEHPGLGLANTIFIALLVLIGSFWMYTSYHKKKYIIVSGVAVAGLILGSYFAAPLLRKNSNTISESCPVLKQDTKSASTNTFTAPGNEFESASPDSTKSGTDSAHLEGFTAASKDEFQGQTENEFKASGDEFSAADSKPAVSEKGNVAPGKPDAPTTLNMTMIYEPLVIFLIIAVIGILIRYQRFRNLRGFFLLGGLLYLGFFRGACPCMISGFQNGIILLFGAPVRWESVLWFLLLVPATYLFGRIWCGWLCHLGALQEFIYKGQKLSLLQGRKAQRILKIIQISVFVLWILQMIITHTNLYCTIDPFKAAFNLYSANLTGWILLGVLLISSILIYRPFCRTICPVGLVLGWISYLPGARKLQKNEHCIHCKSCSNECSYRAMIYENKIATLKNEDCIMCGECISSCKKDALHISCKSNKKTGIIVMLFLLFTSTSAFAQWECPSRLGANLKPIGSSNLMWSSELTTSAGYAGSFGIGNVMLFGGLDYTSGKNTFYVEGGIKNWGRFNSDENISRFARVGLREAFYKYNGTKQNITIGLQSMKSDDDYLINERVAGINYKLNTGDFNINVQSGSVMKEFARNGTFCTVGYLYNIATGRERALLGNAFGQTNMALVTLSYSPGKSASSDEFSGGSDDSKTKDSFLKLNSIGALAYYEFGSWLTNKPFISGLYANTSIAGITFKPEFLLQSATNNKALIYSLYADKQIEWNNGQMTRAFGRYIGISETDKGAMALNSFSNVFAGEVIRLDALELPLFQAGIKHSFTKIKTSVKLQCALQTGTPRSFIPDDINSTPSKMKEVDLSVSKNMGKHFLLTAYGGYLVYPTMENIEGYLTYVNKKSPWGKVELRFTF